MMSKIQQTKEELKRHLLEQIYFLKSSCISFDAGFFIEAKRLGTVIRVLLHDTNNSKSLLNHLGIKDDLKFINTANEYSEANLVSHTGLVLMSCGSNGTSYKAHLNDGPPYLYTQPKMNFSDWWSQIIIADTSGSKFTRGSLVLDLVNKDGGAHIDSALKASYAALTRENSVGWVVSDGISEQPLMDIELHSVRQIAHELLETLKIIDLENI